MELTYLLLTGGLSGIVSSLAHSVFWSLVQWVAPRSATTIAEAQPDVATTLMHTFAGVGLGLLFWLSWGLAAVVDGRWWVRGVAFGGLCWLALALPTIVSVAYGRRVSIRATAAVAAHWATTCLIAGLACAWSWSARL